MTRDEGRRTAGALLASPSLLLAVAPFFWASNFVIGRALRGDVPPITLNFWRWAENYIGER